MYERLVELVSGWYTRLTSTSAARLPLVIAPRTGHKASIIYLHGALGSASVAAARPQGPAYLLSQVVPGAKVLVLEAGTRKLGLAASFGLGTSFIGRAWWNLTGTGLRTVEHPEEIEEAAELVLRVIRSEIAGGVPAGSIFLAGNSQGAALALAVALWWAEQPLGGVVSICGYVPLTTQVFGEFGIGFTLPAHRWKPENTKTPVWFGQGGRDETIFAGWSSAWFHILVGCGVPATLARFAEVGHVQNVEMVQSAGLWIKQQIEGRSDKLLVAVSQTTVRHSDASGAGAAQGYLSAPLFDSSGNCIGALADFEHTTSLQVPFSAEWSEAEAAMYRTVLFQAARLPDTDSMLKVLKAGLPVDTVDENGWTALHHAMGSRSEHDIVPNAVTRLGKLGPCCFNMQDAWGNTPLHLIARTPSILGYYETLVDFALITHSCDLSLINHEQRSVRSYLCAAPDRAGRLARIMSRRLSMDSSKFWRWWMKGRTPVSVPCYGDVHPLIPPICFYFFYGLGIPMNNMYLEAQSGVYTPLIQPGAMLVVWAVTIALHVTLMLMEPGRAKPSPWRPDKRNTVYCITCDGYHPPALRTKHCAECNACFELLDHHCSFFNGVVAVRTIKFFAAWVVLFTWSVLLTEYQGTCAIVNSWPHPFKGFSTTFTVVHLTNWVVGNSAAIFAGITGTKCFLAWSQGVTTTEWRKGSRELKRMSIGNLLEMLFAVHSGGN